MLSILGIIQAFNEADIIEETISYLSPVVDDLIVFDHGSDDGTLDLIPPSMLQSIPRSGIEKTFPFISSFIRSQPHDWVIWQAADEFLLGPFDQPLSRSAIEAEANLGTQVIDPILRNFWPSTADEPDGPIQKRLLHYLEQSSYFPTPRAWFRPLTGVMPLGGHRHHPPHSPWHSKRSGGDAAWPKGTKIDTTWFLNHYPIRSEAQMLSKLKRNHTAGRPFYARFRTGYPPKPHWNPYPEGELKKWNPSDGSRVERI